MWKYNYSNELYHFGIKGMKWGRRRYQNADGSLTSAGKSRYGTVASVAGAMIKTAANPKTGVISEHSRKEPPKNAMVDGYIEQKRPKGIISEKAHDVAFDKSKQKNQKTTNEATNEKKVYPINRKKAIKVGAAVAGTALAAYGTYKASQYINSENGTVYRNKGKEIVKDVRDRVSDKLDERARFKEIDRLIKNQEPLERPKKRHLY